MDPITQPFILASNTAKESAMITTLLVWSLILIPLLGLVSWRVMVSFGSTAASIVGGIFGVVLLVGILFYFSHKESYTLTITPDAVQVINNKSVLIESLKLRELESEIAQHIYIGRTSVRIPVLILRDKTHVLSIGADLAPEPPADTPRVSAPNFTIERTEFERLKAALVAANVNIK